MHPQSCIPAFYRRTFDLLSSDRLLVLIVSVGAAALALVYSLGGPYNTDSGTAALYVQAESMARAQIANVDSVNAVLVGALMRAGIPFTHASSLLPAIALAVTATLLTVSRIAVPVALGLILGMFSAAYIWTVVELNHADITGALALMSALCAYETGRSRRWPMWSMFAAGALTLVACALSPWTIGLALSPCVYLALIYREKGMSGIVSSGAAIAIGALSAAGLLWLIAGWAWLERASAGWTRMFVVSSLSAGVQSHVSAYASFAGRAAEDAWHRPALALFMWPAFLSPIPLAVWAPALLAAFRDSRSLALAAIPPLAIITGFGLAAAEVGEAGYVPEVALFLTAALIVVLKAAAAISARLEPARRRHGEIVATAVVAAFVVQAVPRAMMERWNLDAGPRIGHVVRAAARETLGDAAVVAVVNRQSWYISGGRYVWDAAAELVGEGAQAEDVIHALEEVDAVVLTHDDLDHPGALKLLGHWYDARRLAFTGLVVATDGDGRPTRLALLLRARGDRPPLAFFVHGDVIRRFQLRADGPARLTIAICPTTTVLLDSGELSVVRIPLGTEDASGRALIVAMGNKAGADAWPATLTSECVVREQLAGDLMEVAATDLTRRGGEDPIEFFDALADATSAAARRAQ